MYFHASTACFCLTWEFCLHPDITSGGEKNLRLREKLPLSLGPSIMVDYKDLILSPRSGYKHPIPSHPSCLLHPWPDSAELKPMLTPERDSIIPTPQFEENSFWAYSISDSIFPLPRKVLPNPQPLHPWNKSRWIVQSASLCVWCQVLL